MSLLLLIMSPCDKLPLLSVRTHTHYYYLNPSLPAVLCQ